MHGRYCYLPCHVLKEWSVGNRLLCYVLEMTNFSTNDGKRSCTLWPLKLSNISSVVKCWWHLLARISSVNQRDWFCSTQVGDASANSGTKIKSGLTYLWGGTSTASVTGMEKIIEAVSIRRTSPSVPGHVTAKPECSPSPSYCRPHFNEEWVIVNEW